MPGSEIPLTPRQVQIVLAVVCEHVRTKAPVGSRVVQEAYGVEASTATIRNEMMALEQAGYLTQPHTSAGRLPRDSAYRIYVNHLLQSGAPEVPAVRWVPGEYRRLAEEPHELLRETSRVLARMTFHPAVVTSPPPADPTILSLRLQPVSAETVLLQYKVAPGEERYHLLRVTSKVTATELIALSQALQNLVQGRPVSALASLAGAVVQQEIGETPVPGELVQAIREAAALDDETAVYVDGTSYILDEPEFEERELLRALMRTLDEDSVLKQVLRGALEGGEITVTIGQENPLAAMQGCSLVASTYYQGRSRGAVGILGPMRMDYTRAMGAVTFIARRLTEALRERSPEDEE